MIKFSRLRSVSRFITKGIHGLETRDDMRQYWKSLYGYELPDNFGALKLKVRMLVIVIITNLLFLAFQLVLFFLKVDKYVQYILYISLICIAQKWEITVCYQGQVLAAQSNSRREHITGSTPYSLLWVMCTLGMYIGVHRGYAMMMTDYSLRKYKSGSLFHSIWESSICNTHFYVKVAFFTNYDLFLTSPKKKCQICPLSMKSWNSFMFYTDRNFLVRFDI